MSGTLLLPLSPSHTLSFIRSVIVCLSFVFRSSLLPFQLKTYIPPTSAGTSKLNQPISPFEKMLFQHIFLSVILATLSSSLATPVLPSRHLVTHILIINAPCTFIDSLCL